MGGPAGEAIVFKDETPLLMAADVTSAHALARIVCRSETSRVGLVEHANQEALALCGEHEPVRTRAATKRGPQSVPWRLIGESVVVVIKSSHSEWPTVAEESAADLA
jgi:hypothetical protein